MQRFQSAVLLPTGLTVLHITRDGEGQSHRAGVTSQQHRSSRGTALTPLSESSLGSGYPSPVIATDAARLRQLPVCGPLALMTLRCNGLVISLTAGNVLIAIALFGVWTDLGSNVRG